MYKIVPYFFHHMYQMFIVFKCAKKGILISNILMVYGVVCIDITSKRFLYKIFLWFCLVLAQHWEHSCDVMVYNFLQSVAILTTLPLSVAISLTEISDICLFLFLCCLWPKIKKKKNRGHCFQHYTHSALTHK